MRQTGNNATWTWRWGVSASIAVHALIVALIVFGLPLPELTPDEPDAIAVELVPPPEPAPEPEPVPEPAPEPAPPPEPTPPPEPEPAENAQAPEAEPPQSDATALENEPERKVLDPVFEFGEQDAGPRLADDGSAASEERAAAEEPEPEPSEQLPDGTVTVVPEPRPRVELTEVEQLFSPAANGSLAAMTAMEGMPRDRRAGELCVTEMREQLRRADPPFWPDLLPAYRLVEGTLMEVHEAAFRAGGEWYDLAFRCEVDDAVTRVVSFAFTVGNPIPRSEWGSRGLPAS